MKIYLDCYPCFLRQALDASRMAGVDEEEQKVVLDQVLDVLEKIDSASVPPEIGVRVHSIVRREVGDGDPYRAVKETSTQEALALYPRLKKLVAEAEDPLDTAVRLSIAGNIIDFGPEHAYDLWETVERVLAQPFAIDDRAAFRKTLDRAKRVLYLADNAGETVFDRVLIETLDVPVIYVVKGSPVINDATRKDAVAAGLDQVAEVIDNGTNAPGTILEHAHEPACSDDFRQHYEEADLTIAKGQANYETLSNEAKEHLFFLLQTKCPVIAHDVGVPVKSIVLKQALNSRQR